MQGSNFVPGQEPTPEMRARMDTVRTEMEGFQAEADQWLAAIRNLLTPAQQIKRSEEHTSELQSPCNLVCRLLLEKKKKKRRTEKIKNGAFPSPGISRLHLQCSTCRYRGISDLLPQITSNITHHVSRVSVQLVTF